MEKEVVELQESTNLFDVSIPDYRDVKLCRRDIAVLKELWDIVVFVQVSSPMHKHYSEGDKNYHPSSPQHNSPVSQYLEQYCPLGDSFCTLWPPNVPIQCP